MAPTTVITVLELTKLGLEVAKEALAFARTEQGQALIKQSLEDRAAFSNNVIAAGNWLEKFLTGKLGG